MKQFRFFQVGFFFLLVLVFYFPTRYAGFVTDFFGWQLEFDQGSWKDVLTTFHWHANQQVAAFFFFSMYKIFGMNGWGWYLVFSLLHGANGWLAYKLFSRLFEKHALPHAKLIALTGSVLFLLSPYNAEVLVWRVCIHYLLATFFMLLLLYRSISFLETGNKMYLWQVFGLFFLSLFTLEISLATPALSFIIAVTWMMNGLSVKISRKRLMFLIIPQFALIGFFFLLNKLLLNEWVGHYGAAVHLNISFVDVASKYFKYLLKYLLFFRFWDYNFQMKIFSFIENKVFLFFLYGFLVIALLLVIGYFRKISTRLKLVTMSALLFFAALTPVITLYMVTLLYGENDRYGYLAAIFFWMMMTLLFSLLPKKFFYGITAATLVVTVFFLLKMNAWWAENDRIYKSLLDDFRWYDKEEVVILNLPDNYHGLYMFRIYNQPSGLKEALAFIHKKQFTGEMHEVTQYNMMTPTDAVNVKADSADQLKVTLSQWG
ncbi:MAG TPA: hypothetical protein PLD84_10430, partial [Chitinophagales bacterium]|nr:hypothetical protein [Chitinophagales bacterium]